MSNNTDKNKNDKAWEVLFEKYNILEEIHKNGVFEIASTQINAQREARLMTKFDHKINLPKLFQEDKLAILPNTRGTYIISKFEAYKEVQEIESPVFNVSLPDYIESIDYNNITSEAVALNCAFVSGILADFTGDEYLLPTVSGRMSSNYFKFLINNIDFGNSIEICVSNSQIEIDAGYEGINSLFLIEAKNIISKDFLIRQLYYPFRLWSNNINKSVVPIFLTYSNGIFTLSEYQFKDQNNYNSLVLLKQKKYIVEQEEITLYDIINILNNVKVVEESNIQFPQADSFSRIINLCELLYEYPKTHLQITSEYIFAPRQTNYYTDAGRYLGLIDKTKQDGDTIFSLSEEGKKIFNLRYKTRQLKLVELILKHKVFNVAIRRYLEKSDLPVKNDIVEIMKNSNIYHVEADSTFKRRASTVLSWINWILELQNK